MVKVWYPYLVMNDMLITLEFQKALDGAPHTIRPCKHQNHNIQEFQDGAAGGATGLEARDANVLNDD